MMPDIVSFVSNALEADMSMASVKWSSGTKALCRGPARKRSTARPIQMLPAALSREAGGARSRNEEKDRSRRIVRRRVVARVEHALFLLILGTVGYLWLMEAAAGF